MPRRHHADRVDARPLPPRWFSWDDKAFGACIPALNQLLADTIMLRDLYGKHRWQATDGSFHPQHLLFEKHHAAQSDLGDRIAERVVALGGTPVMARHVGKMTRIARPPAGCESPADQIARLLEAHDAILTLSHDVSDLADRLADDVTGALVAGDVIRQSEAQVWLLLEHLAGAPLVDRSA